MDTLGSIARSARRVAAAKTPGSAVLFSLASRTLIFVTNVATGIIVARTLGPEGRGATGAINLWMLLVPGILTFGIPAALRYEVPRRIQTPSDLFSGALLITSVLGLIAIIIGFAIMPHVLGQYSVRVISAAQLMMFFAPLILWNATVQAFYESIGDFRTSNALIYAPPIGTLLGLLLLYSLHMASVYSFALVYPLPVAIVTIITLVRLRKYLVVPPFLGDQIRVIFSYGFRAYGIDIVNTLSAQVDQAIVVGLLSAASFGLYAVAVGACSCLLVLGNALNAVLVPTAAALDGQRAIELVSRSARLVFAATLLSTIIFIIVLPLVVPIMYGREYLPIIRLTQVLSLAILLSATSATFVQAFMATGRPELATAMQAVRIIITVPFMIFLVPKYGLVGAAYGLVLANGIRLALVLSCYPVFLRHRIPRLFVNRQDIRDLSVRLKRIAA